MAEEAKSKRAALSAYDIATQLVHAGEREPPQPGAPVATPVYTTATFTYGSMADMDAVFAGDKPGYVYTRHGNPTVQALADALQTLDTHGTCRVTIETSDGITGTTTIGFGRLDAAPSILAHLINDELAPAVIGEDPFHICGIRDKLWDLTDYHGAAGLALFGIAGIDVALWDTVGKAVGQPLSGSQET